jgi:hypothetical protein
MDLRPGSSTKGDGGGIGRVLLLPTVMHDSFYRMGK